MDLIGCIICHDAFSDKQDCVVAKCGHAFDENCIRDWMTKSPTCPTCRSPSSVYDLAKVHFSLIPENQRTEVQDLRVLLENMGMKEAVASSQVENLRKEMEMVQIEKNTLNEDLQAALLKVQSLEAELDKENTKKAERLSRLAGKREAMRTLREPLRTREPLRRMQVNTQEEITSTSSSSSESS